MASKKKRPSPYGSVKFETIDQYHASWPPEIRAVLDRMRGIIKKAAPRAVEIISYNMPAFRGHRNLVYYAAHKAHLGFYPAVPTDLFAEQLKGYTTSKGAIQFPYDKPLPAGLITKIVKIRVQSDLETAKTRLK